MMKPHHTLRATAVAVVTSMCFAATPGADAERPARDPTVPPYTLPVPASGAASANAALPASGARTAAPVPAAVSRHILIINGHRYVVEGGRRRSVGDTLGGARIERIEDSAIWVREAGTLQRLPMFGSAVRRAAAPQDAAQPPSASAAEGTTTSGAGRVLSRTLQPGEPS